MLRHPRGDTLDSEDIIRLYTLLLLLFPRRHQDEFGPEMAEVFSQMLRDADEMGEGVAWRIFFREALDLPGFALREHWLERKRPRYDQHSHPFTRKMPAEHAAAIIFGIFILPGLVSLAFPPLSTVFASLITLLLLAIAVTIIYGLKRGADPWLLLLFGGLAGVAGIYGIDPAVRNAAAVAIRALRPDAAGSLLSPTGLIGIVFETGLVWASIVAAVSAVWLTLHRLPGFQLPAVEARNDWIGITFMLYGAVPVYLLAESTVHQLSLPISIAILLIIGFGAAGYLRAYHPFVRVLSLLTAVGAAFLALGAMELLAFEGQGWLTAQSAPSIVNNRALIAFRAVVAWIWISTVLISPWLIRRRPPFVANLVLVGLWMMLFSPIYRYLWTISTNQEFRLNQFALLGVVGLLIHQAHRGGFSLRLCSPPAFYPPALMMLLGSALLFILVEHLLDINTLSAALFGLSLYGLVGLWLRPQRWRDGLPAALLLIATLPFGEHLQTFVGYPVRLITAGIVRDGLAGFGVNSVGVDTILVFENGISQVDLPCSGVKSLWTGGMFFLAATWIERRRFHLRWITTGLMFVILLFLANLLRVMILVSVGQVLGWVLLAEMLHVPLGVLGFAAACAFLVWMLRRFVPGVDETTAADTNARTEGLEVRPRWLTPLLFAANLLLIILYSPRPQPAAAQAEAIFSFQPELVVREWPFTPEEADWLSADGPLSANRWRFEWLENTGSLLLITSDTWRAHHRPERCFEAYGLKIEASQSRLLSTDFPIRQVSLSGAKGSRQYTAVYWLQSPDRVTDDYALRIWSDIAPERTTWVLVTILFDRSIDPLEPEFSELYAGLRRSVDRSLLEGTQ